MNLQSDLCPFFSIVTVCLNSDATIARSLDSLLHQTFTGFELIIIDGKSTDRTLEIIDAYVNKFIERNVHITVRSEPDNGIYDAINKGIGLCTGTVIGILNSDDYYELDSLDNIAKVFYQNDQYEIVYGLLRQWKNKQELGVYRYNYDYILSSLESGIESSAQHPACFVKKSVYDRIGLFDTTFPIAADYDFLLRAKRADVNFMPIDEVVSNFSLGGASSHITNYDRLEQRYRAQYKNGLLSDDEFRANKLYLRRMQFAQWRKRFVDYLTGSR